MKAIRIVLTIVLVACALFVSALVVRQELLFRPTTPFQQPVPEAEQVLPDSLWEAISEYQTALGPRSAPVRLVEFYDYECPFCLALHPVLDSIRTRYPDDVALIFRHFPLSYHPGAYTAALAAECAHEQSDFKALHDVLFAHQKLLSTTSVNWTLLASDAGISDVKGFHTCVTKRHTAHRVHTDTLLAHQVGIDGIPTVVVNGEMYSGVLSTDELDAIIQQALKGSEEPPLQVDHQVKE